MPSFWNSKEIGLGKWRTVTCCRGILVFRWALLWPVHIKSVWHNDCLWISNLVLGNYSLYSKVGKMETSAVDPGKGKKVLLHGPGNPTCDLGSKSRYKQVSCLQVWINHLTRPEGKSYPSSAALNCRIWFPCLWPTSWASAGESLLLQGAPEVTVSWNTVPFSRLCCVQSCLLAIMHSFSLVCATYFLWYICVLKTVWGLVFLYWLLGFFSLTLSFWTRSHKLIIFCCLFFF